MVVSTTQRIAESGIVAIIRGTDPETAIETADALHRGGVSTVEITADIESVLNMTRNVSELLAADGVTIGARIILDTEMVQVATLAGAEFIIMPSFDEGVVETVNCYDVSSLVGIATPTEAVNAFKAGADIVRVSPVGTLGPRSISILGGPFGYIPTVPTGGAGLGNMDEFPDAGTTAVGVGSSTIDTEAIACGEFDVIEANARVFRKAVEAVRSE